MPDPVKLFFAYAREDEVLRDKLALHLTPLRRLGLIDDWHDRAIDPGSEWEAAIDAQLHAVES